MKKKILFLGQLPENISPSQRFRIEIYKDLLKANELEYYFQPFISKRHQSYLYKKGKTLNKIMAVMGGFVRRFLGLFKYAGVDYVFVQREASPIGPPIFEWAYVKLLRKKMIYDFDDAVWIPNVTEGNRLAGYVKCYWKIRKICKWSDKVSVGNGFLENFAKNYNPNTVRNITCVDTDRRYKAVVNQRVEKLTIGWTGSHSTLKYLDLVVPMLKKLEQLFDFRFLVICNEKPAFELRSMEFIYWNPETEIEDLSQFNIGIMPLINDAWSEGKCGFKIIQYLALGIPAVASPVGVNKTIIDDGVNGFLCGTEEEWIQSLTRLIQDENKRVAFGKAGRSKIIERYSLASNASNFLSLFSS